MIEDARVSSGEIYRVLLEVRAEVRAQNSRIRKLEDDAIRIKTIWSGGAIAVALFGDWAKRKIGL